ncbi:hypothetical protein N7508_003003 [Penicillium antarcticum]|uniref:uncharacterized protein n=1 Tax=Penicillium antarcticum TaxID=416450 RepID=UPI0023A6170D|nr:uncharacterized protein N7508_003003 [Penicillium antarcticum]KAJ5312173.1 hypothetical protein N7508_003003 [Penicillium antarcticum]
MEWVQPSLHDRDLAVAHVAPAKYDQGSPSPDLPVDRSLSYTPARQDEQKLLETPTISQQPFLMLEPAPPETSSNPLDWLSSRHLPNVSRTRVLVEEYFNNVHPLRAFAFMHKPSFLQRLDGELAKSRHNHALLHVVCALGAQFYSLTYSETKASLASKFILHAGAEWAKIAQRIILEALDSVTIENLMAAVLLHDYAVRLGNFSNAFMLSGITTRMTQALQINLEYNTDVLCHEAGSNLLVTARESRRRLMWSCYIMDALVGSGVDQLTLMDERDIKIQLPCNERNFTQQVPCLTETLNPGNRLKLLPGDQDTNHVSANMGIMAYFIRHIALRKRVLRYIKHLGDAMVPWSPESEFALLDADCRAWYESLPASLQFTSDAIYIRKDTSQLGSLCILHCAHYQTICDLYRLGAPALYKLRAAFDFPPEQHDFLQHLQQVLFDAARALATIIGQTARHGLRMLADSWLPTITYDSCRIIVYHLTQILDPREESTRVLILATIPLLRSNIAALKSMDSLNAIANSLGCAAETMLDRSGIESEVVTQNIIPDDPYQPDAEDDTNQSITGTPAQSAPDYVLNPLTIFRMARRTIPERHAPEKASTSTSSAPNSVRSDPHAELDRSSARISDGRLLGGNDALDTGQASLEELQTLFMSDLGWAWQPADTAVGSGIDGPGLLPWAGGYPVGQTEPWLPVFPFPQQE